MEKPGEPVQDLFEELTMLTVDPKILRIFDEATIAEGLLASSAEDEETAGKADLVNKLNQQWPYTHATLKVTGEARQVEAVSGYAVQLSEVAPGQFSDQAMTSLGFAIYHPDGEEAPQLGLVLNNLEQGKLYVAPRDGLAIEYPFRSVEFMSMRAQYFMPKYTNWVDRVCEQQAYAEEKALALADFCLPGTTSGEIAMDMAAYLSEKLDLDSVLPYIASYRGKYFTFDASDSGAAVTRLMQYEAGGLVTQPSPFFVKSSLAPGEFELCLRVMFHQADKERAPIDMAIPVASLESLISCRRIAADSGN